jgi:hypothetical protein
MPYLSKSIPAVIVSLAGCAAMIGAASVFPKQRVNSRIQNKPQRWGKIIYTIIYQYIMLDIHFFNRISSLND